MPANLNLSSLDFSGCQEGKMNRELVDHLFMLKEQLEYTLSNLDETNFNYKFFDTLTVRVQDGLNIEGVVTFKALAENEETVINGAYIKTGTVEASLFKTYAYPVSNGTAGVTNGEILMYYTDEYLTSPLLAGGLKMDYEGAGTDTEATFRVFLYTEALPRTNFKVALKLQSAYRASLEAKEQIYIHCADAGSKAGVITLEATVIDLKGLVMVNGTIIE